MDLNFENKTAMVCGSTQGIGKAAAMELASLGASVVLVARNEDRLKEALADLPGEGHSYICADFGKQEELKEKIESFVNEGGKAEILVNNTGGPPGGQAVDADVQEFRIAFNNHLVCNHILTTALVPHMKEAGYGRIINVISTSVKVPIKGLGVSNTIRGAVANWSKTLANELGTFGITVNNILPGATSTARLSSIIENVAKKNNAPEADIEAHMKKEIPAGRFASAEEVAYAIAFLASPSASYINGINVPVDGGRTPSL